MARQTKMTLETESLKIVRGQKSPRAWCSLYEAEVEMVAVQSVGVITNLDQLALEAWLNSGALHRSRSADGSEQICLNSLLARVLKTQNQ